MTNKTINIAITDNEAVIDAAMDAFVRQNGWTEESEQSKNEKAREVLRDFIMETVTAYNITQAQNAATQAAKAQTAAAFDLTTMVLTVG